MAGVVVASVLDEGSSTISLGSSRVKVLFIADCWASFTLEQGWDQPIRVRVRVRHLGAGLRSAVFIITHRDLIYDGDGS